jgi:hypothetical protein
VFVRCFYSSCVDVLCSSLLVILYCVRLLEVGLVGRVCIVAFICYMWCCFGETIGIGMC